MTSPQLVFGARPWLEELSAHAWSAAQANLTPRPDGDLLASVPGLGRSWLWDTCFMAMYAKYAPDLLPVDRSLDLFHRGMRDDGFVGMAYELESGALSYGERINPPLLAWAEWQLFQVTGDRSRLARILSSVVCSHGWIDQHRRRPTGLFWYEDSGSSGMDNAPRGGYPSPALDGSDLCHVDLLAQQALSARSIGQIAAVLGREHLVTWADQEHRELRQLLETQHWSESSRFYHDLFARPTLEERHNFVNHRTVAAFWPLLAGLASPERAAVLAATLEDPADFGTPHRVPSLSASDPNFDPEGGYWLGGVWSPTNYMVCKGLWDYGHAALASQIVQDHVAALGVVAAQQGGLWEAYAPRGAAPATVSPGRTVRPNFVGWTGLSVISLVIECMIGLDLSASDRTVRWRPQLVEQQGVRHLRFVGGQVSLVGELTEDRRAEVEIDTTVGFTLEIHLPGSDRIERFDCSPGHHRFATTTPVAGRSTVG